ncbi:MAG: sodium:calcium exchanger [Kangiella sp.]|nr:MAG: sodium:calcium exchanger [Kangiella sp.]
MKISFNKLNLALMITGLSLTVIGGMALAHSGAHPERFVSNTGIDKGSCNKKMTPCRTIGYAVQQSGKGDKVLVANGEYIAKEEDIFYFLSDMVIVKGGYNEQTKFKTQSLNGNRTTVTGIPAKYRENLKSKGFHLVRDKKGKKVNLSAETIAMLATYEKITSKKEGPINCVGGVADSYACNNIDLLSHMPLGEFSANPTSANDIWGFTDLDDNREYALIGLNNGTSIVDVTNPESPVEVGSIGGLSSIWRDIKAYQCKDEETGQHKAWAYVTTEANQGLQVIDLSDLPNSISLVNTVSEFNGAHNVYMSNIDYTTNSALDSMEAFIYVAGARKNSGAYRVFSLADPANPELITSPPVGTGYIHDATTLVITDDRTGQCANSHNPCELLIDYNESSVDIWDMTDKQNPFKISSTTYTNSSYTHSGWWSADKQYLFIHDEGDESDFGINTTVNIMDISDLANPVVLPPWRGPEGSIDHNGFTKGNRYYMSAYRSGLMVLDVTDPAAISLAGNFDTFPVPAANTAEFNGAWGAYPYLPSGNILISDFEIGLFVLKDNTNPTGYVAASNAASCPSTGGVNSAPTASFTDDCNDLACSFNGSASTDSDGSITSYAWDFGDTKSSTETSPSNTYAADGTYDVALTVTDNDGATNTSISSVTVSMSSGGVNSAPTASFTNNCTELVCSFNGSASSDSDGNIASYAWDFGDGSSSTETSPANTYAADGTYSVSLTVTDNEGATNVLSANVTVAKSTAGSGDTDDGSSSGSGSIAFLMLAFLSVIRLRKIDK